MADNPVANAANAAASGAKSLFSTLIKPVSWAKDRIAGFAGGKGWLVIPLFFPLCAWVTGVAAAGAAASAAGAAATAGGTISTGTATAAVAAGKSVGILDLAKTWVGVAPGQVWSDVPTKIVSGTNIIGSAINNGVHGNLGAGITFPSPLGPVS